MNCSNCGTYNNSQSKFCIKCGSALDTTNINSQTNVVNQNNDVQQNNYHETINNVQAVSSVNVNTAPLNYFMYLIAILLKPFQCYKEEEGKLNNGKTAFILTLIITVVMTVLNMIQTIISTVRVASYSFSSGYTHSWQWDNLKNIKWLEVIGKNFIIYACIILAITIVFYLGSLVVKKELSFIKSLSISATSVIPAVCGSMILAPILGMIWEPLGVVFTFIGFVYSLIILYEFMNNELNLEKNKKIYFNLACFGILVIASYYSYMKLIYDLSNWLVK